MYSFLNQTVVKVYTLLCNFVLLNKNTCNNKLSQGTQLASFKQCLEFEFCVDKKNMVGTVSC